LQNFLVVNDFVHSSAAARRSLAPAPARHWTRRDWPASSTAVATCPSAPLSSFKSPAPCRPRNLGTCALAGRCRSRSIGCSGGGGAAAALELEAPFKDGCDELHKALHTAATSVQVRVRGGRELQACIVPHHGSPGGGGGGRKQCVLHATCSDSSSASRASASSSSCKATKHCLLFIVALKHSHAHFLSPSDLI
jgi:hypothetical protein